MGDALILSLGWGQLQAPPQSEAPDPCGTWSTWKQSTRSCGRDGSQEERGEGV